MRTQMILAAVASLLLGISCSDKNSSVPTVELEPTPEVPVKDQTITLKDNNTALTNPGMGWNLMYYTFDDVRVPHADEEGELFDYIPCDIVSFRLSWAKIEPKEGQYNWAVIDDVANAWTAAGKRLSFKFYTNFLWDHADKQATPLWVRAAGAKGRMLDNDGKPDNDTWMANYNDPILIEKLGNFYKAVAEHYKTSSVEFIELGSIGRVGEGNSYQIGVEPTEEEYKSHIGLLKKYFPNTRLVINDDYGAKACAYAKTVGYSIDDHSIGVGSSTNPPGRGYNATILDKFKDGTVTIGLEDDTWLVPDEWYFKQMVAACANYCRIHVSPSALMKDDAKPVVESMNLKMGYRFQFPSITIPDKVERGKTFMIKYSIKNVGVGCCTVECYPRFIFLDKDGKEVLGVTDKTVTGAQLKYGKDDVVVESSLAVQMPADVKASDVTMYVSIVDKDEHSIIKLPYTATTINGKKLYKVASLLVK